MFKLTKKSFTVAASIMALGMISSCANMCAGKKNSCKGKDNCCSENAAKHGCGANSCAGLSKTKNSCKGKTCSKNK